MTYFVGVRRIQSVGRDSSATMRANVEAIEGRGRVPIWSPTDAYLQ
jgi:hypothetical protein